jgi:hypothetical protein
VGALFDLLTDGRIPREAISPLATGMARDGVTAEAAAALSGIALEPRELAEPRHEPFEGYRVGKDDSAAGACVSWRESPCTDSGAGPRRSPTFSAANSPVAR